MSACMCMGCPHRANCRCRCSECAAELEKLANLSTYGTSDTRLADMERRLRALEEGKGGLKTYDSNNVDAIAALRNALPALAELVEAGEQMTQYLAGGSIVGRPNPGQDPVDMMVERWDEALRRVAESLGVTE